VKRTSIRSVSQKRRDRMAEVKPLRDSLIKQAGRCMVCSVSTKQARLACHEILNGGLRDKTLDEPCSLLVLCWNCNSNEMTDKQKWPAARQLAVLQSKSPEHYDLERFNWLRNPKAPNFVTQEEVDGYSEGLD
jgi:hypothetical protein